MAAEYKLRLFTSAGVLQAEVTDFLKVAYTKAINAPGLATFQLNADHNAIALLSNRSQIEIWRRNRALDLDWYCDFYGLFLDQLRQEPQLPLFTAYCPGQMWLLGTRHVLWYARTSNRSRFASVAAETVLKTLVVYNAGASATTGNGRLRTGTITGISNQADGSGGNTISWSCAWKNLLEELQDIARVAGGDFDLIKTGAATWQFRWYTGQRGTDRSATVIFATSRGNMANPIYRYSRIAEKTVALAAGQGDGSARETAIRTGDDYAASNDVEVFVDARNVPVGDTAGLQAAADEALDENQAREDFGFDVLQTQSCAYGVHYCIDGDIGDLVTARYLALSATLKIIGVTVQVQPDGSETIDLEMETQ